MHPQFVLPAMLCVAGLIVLADLWPIEVELSPDQNPDYEDDLETAEDNLKATQTNNGAATTSSI